MAFNDSNNTIFTDSLKTSDITDIQFSLLENKKSGILRLNIREFKHTDEYDGPTRNGMLLKISSPDEIDQYQQKFNNFFEEIKKHI